MMGFSGEIGAAFAFTEGLSANVGFKGQTFWGDDDNDDEWEDTFTGVTLGLSYTF
jgi:opacity protein-like surface antigen